MRRLALALVMLACGPAPTPTIKPPTSQIWRAERIDDALIDRVLHAIALQFEDRSWVSELKEHRQVAPHAELAWIDQALRWGEKPFSSSYYDPALAAVLGDGFAAIYPDDVCIRAIAVDVSVLYHSDDVIDTFVKCFPTLARAHQYAGEKCRRMPEVPAERELQLFACAKNFVRCIELDAHHPSCARELAELQRQWVAPYCTTASLSPKVVAKFDGDAGTMMLDVADFEYGIQGKVGVVLVLSTRGRQRVRAWFDALKTAKKFDTAQVTTRVGSFPATVWREAFTIEVVSPTPTDVCDQTQQRNISDFP